MKAKQIQTTEQLKSLVNIGDFIGKYVKLIQRNNKLIGLCPFHKEKTPSFHVSEDFYYCFGCHATGDVIKFVQEYHAISFIDSIKQIAQDIGVEINVSEQNPEQKQKNDRQYAILRDVKDYYKQNIGDKLSVSWLYLTQKRKLDLETIQNFEIGFSPTIKNQLYKHLMDLKYSKQEILSSGIVREYGTNYSDFFEARIIIPIKDHSGMTIGFGGRILNSENNAKYINSAESDLFKKRETLFNFAKAKQAKMTDKNCPIIMVEGYMDVISMHQFSFYGAIAPLGTGVTEQQIKMALSLDKQMFFCFNSDLAGRVASLKIAQMLACMMIKPNLNPKFIDLKTFKDVDDLLNSDVKQGKYLFEQKLTQANNLNDFIWLEKSKTIDKKDPNKMAQLEDDLIKFAETIPNNIIKKSYIRFFKQKIFEFSRNNKQIISTTRAFIDKNVPDVIEENEKYIIALFMAYPELKNNEDIGIESIVDNFSDMARKSYYTIISEDLDNMIDVLSKKIDNNFLIKIQKTAEMIKHSTSYIKKDNYQKFFVLRLERAISQYILARLKTGFADDINLLIGEQNSIEQRISQIDEEIDKLSDY